MQLTPVEIENERTWPDEFRVEAERHRPLLINYQRERGRIDELAQDDIELRISPPSNQYKPAYQALVSRLEPMLEPHRLVGYHCTRLTPSEITSITENGLRPLSLGLIREKLEVAVRDGHLTQDQANQLQAHEYQRAALNDQRGKRTKMTHFCANRTMLTNSGGVCCLLRYWGGEATRGGPAGHPDILREIIHIGTPCIVKCAVPVLHAKRGFDFTRSIFSHRSWRPNREHPEPQPSFQFYVSVPVTDVLRVIEYDDPEFEQLTGCSGWCERDSLEPRFSHFWIGDPAPPPTQPLPGTESKPRCVLDLSEEEVERISNELDDSI